MKPVTKSVLLVLLSLAGFADGFLLFAVGGENHFPHWFNPFIGMLSLMVLPFWGAMIAMYSNAPQKNEQDCECCGQPRPYPKEPGRWAYRTIVEKDWTNVTIKQDDEGLTVIPDGETEPIWWPNNAEWKQIK